MVARKWNVKTIIAISRYKKNLLHKSEMVIYAKRDFGGFDPGAQSELQWRHMDDLSKTRNP